MRLTKRRWTVLCMALCAPLSGCEPTAAELAQRTGPYFAAWVSDLPVPANAVTEHFVDTFIDPAGVLHSQGVVEATVTLDSATFHRLLDAATKLGYRPVTEYAGSYYRHPLFVAAPRGRYRLRGKMVEDYDLAVLNPDNQTLSVRYKRTTGIPFP